MKQTEISAIPSWITETINGGSLRQVDLLTGTNGWASPPGDVFSLRPTEYFKNKQKTPGGDYLLSPVAVDWLKSSSKLDHVMSRPDNRVAHALRKAQTRGEALNCFIFAVNLQIPSNEAYSLVLYFATEKPIPSDTLLGKLIDGDESFRNKRFKCLSQVFKGPWIVKKATGSLGAFVMANMATCNYHRGTNYLEIDVDASSSAILTALSRLMLGCLASVGVDVGFVVEAQTKDELPERLIGAVRVCQLELSSAFVVEVNEIMQPCRMMGSANTNHNEEDRV